MKHFLSISLFLISLALLDGCKKSSVIPPADFMISTLLSSYTKGVISAQGIVKFVFNSEMLSQQQIQIELVDQNLIQWSPTVTGQTYWENPKTLVFKANKKLESDKEYNITLNVTKINQEMGKLLPKFTYSIKTRPFSISVVDPLVQLSDLDKFELHGKIEASDSYHPDDLEKILVANQFGKKLDIQYSHFPEWNYSNYIVKGIDRGTASKVVIDVDGTQLKSEFKKTIEVNIPDPKDLSILSVSFENDPEIKIITSFSEKLKKNQSLDGLISAVQENVSLRHVIQGNQVYSYLNNDVSGSLGINYSPGILAENGKKLTQKHTEATSIVSNHPAVRFVGKGSIMPQTNDVILPFEAKGLKAVDVEIFKIFDHNILQFLQTNELNQSNELYKVGKIIAQKKVDLNLAGSNILSSKWRHHGIDLKPLFNAEENAIYQIRIGFKPEYTLANCVAQYTTQTQESEGEFVSFFDDNYYGPAGYYERYWEEKEDPCKPSYYNSDRFIARNILVSNLGIIAKVADKNLFAAVTDLRTSEPIPNAQVDIYNFQSSKIATISTDGQGILNEIISEKPYALIINHQTQKGYLRLQEGNNLSTSLFDVEGQEIKKGIQGYVFAERGVWRPGDSLYISFILKNNGGNLPTNYPVSMKLYDPTGKLVTEKISTNPIGNFYSFPCKTTSDSRTGSWKAVVKAGGVEFYKSVLIEAVKPNRLKINFDLKEEIPVNTTAIPLKSEWLTGLTATGLSAKVTGKWSESTIDFLQWKGFSTSDPARKDFIREEFTLYDGKLNNTGEASIPIKLGKDFKPSGKMNLRFNIEVSEPAGDFSTYNNVAIFHPYKSYAAVKLPADDWGYKSISINKPTAIILGVLDTKGKPLANKKLSVGLYRLDWEWWWEQRQGSYAQFNTQSHHNSILQALLVTNNSGIVEWKPTINGWGRYLIRVCDTESGHCAGDFAYAGWPEGDEESESKLDIASLLRLKTRQEKYDSKETVQLQIPAPKLSKMLVTIENGTKVLESRWVNVDKTPFVYTFQATPEMAPAVYAHVSLIQPHGNNTNDMPMRMYGIVPVYIENKEARLEPKINSAPSFKPDKTETIEVSEANGKAMYYTLDIVDEGLLDLTNFKTPDPYNYFHTKPALGVRTWDVYDHVLGAFGGRLESILSIGGDQALLNNKPTASNRFKSPVQHLGPFYLKNGEKQKHQIQIKNYIGSVRAMVVAANEIAYGYAEKAFPVNSALMLLPTLPRVLSAGEKITMPVNLFISDKSLKNVSLSIKDKNNLIKPSAQSISIDNETEKIVYFNIEAPTQVGKSILDLEAKAGNDIVKNEIEIETRNPNPVITVTQSEVVEPGASKTMTLKNIPNANNLYSLLEVATFQPLKLTKHIDHLTQYPYGCAEQTTSAAFAQLHLDDVLQMDANQFSKVKMNIIGGISRLSLFQLNDGSFTYWPGNTQTDHWVTNYIGHFLIEAQKKGYEVSTQVINNWKTYQKKLANGYDISQQSLYRHNHGLDQAYRLYTLAIAGSPDIGAMNRLREYKDLGSNGKKRLAASYAIVGQNEIAKSLIAEPQKMELNYFESGQTYGSPIRDQAMLLETYMHMNENSQAANLAMDLTKMLNSETYFNTQGLAYSLQVLSKFIGKGNGSSNDWGFIYSMNEKSPHTVHSSLPSFFIQSAHSDKSNKITIKNTSSKPLYIQNTIKGQPINDVTEPANNGIQLSVVYRDENGNEFSPGLLAKGQKLKAEITVSHLGKSAMTFNNLALTQIVPAGWEIINDRLRGDSDLEYQDIRDDRIFSFFSLSPGQKKQISTTVRATYAGEYNLPAITCEEMYDSKIFAKTAASVCKVE